MQLPLLFLVNPLDASSFEEYMAPLGRVRVQEGAIVLAGAGCAQVKVKLLLWEVVYGQVLCLLTLLRAILGQL